MKKRIVQIKFLLVLSSFLLPGLSVSGQHKQMLPQDQKMLIEKARPAMPVGVTQEFKADKPGAEIDPESIFSKEHPDLMRIVGGDDAEIKDYPWQTSLQVVNQTDANHVCGATILNEHWVVTAAHCVLPIATTSFLQVRSGFTAITSDEGTFHRVNKGVVHADYDYGSDDRSHDIALLRVSEPFDFDNEAVSKMPLVNAFDVARGLEDPGNEVDISGWGRLTYNGAIPDSLQAAAVTIADINETAYLHEIITDAMIMAGEDGIDACQGDSGGPMIVTDRYGEKKLAGVTSWGVGCGFNGYPGVYTRISHYENWLDHNLKETDPNQYNIVWQEDFEPANDEGSLPDEWELKRNTQADGGLNGNNLEEATTNTWFRNSPMFGLFHEDWEIIDWVRYVNSGEASMMITFNAPDFTWAISPEMELPAGEDVELGFWTWYASLVEENWITNFHVNVFVDDQWHTLKSFGGDNLEDNEFNFMDEEVVLDLSDYAGETIQLAFVYEQNDGIHMSIDDIAVRYGKPDVEVEFDVTDGNEPLADAMLSVSGHEKMITGEAGQVSAMLHEGSYAYSLEKPGYHIVEGEFLVDAAQPAISLSMEKIPAPEMEIYPEAISDSLEEGQQSQHEIVIENSGEQPLEFDLTTFSGQPAEENSDVDILTQGSEHVDQPVELGFDSGVFSGFGAMDPTHFTAAVKFQPEDLEPYYGTHKLAAIKFLIRSGGFDDFKVHIWQGTDEGEPGALIHEEALDQEELNMGNWTTFTLPNHLELLPGEDYWIGYTLYSYAEGYPMAVDNGPAESGKGGWILYHGQWIELSDLDFEFNWCLRGLLEPKADVPWLLTDVDSGTVEAGEQLTVPVTVDASGLKPGSRHATIQLSGNAGPDRMVPVELDVLPASHDVAFDLSNADGQPIPDAQIVFDGEELPVGQYEIDNIFAGTYAYQVTREGYQPVQGNVLVENDLSVPVTMIAESSESISLDIDVEDEFGEPVDSAFVMIDSFGGQITDGNGMASFDLLPGNYTLSTQKTGFADHVDAVEVENTGDQEHAIVLTYNRYDVNASVYPENSGIVEGTGEYPYGQLAELEAIPNESYEFLYWEKDGYSYPANNPFSWEVEEDKDVMAVYRIRYFDIMTSYEGAGNITPTEGSLSPSGLFRIQKDSEITFNIEPSEGYYIEDVIVDGTSHGPMDSFTFESVDADHTIEVVFSIYIFSITVESGENGEILPYNGTIDPDGTVEVDYGSHQSFLINPDEGYVITDVIVDGESIGPQEVYVFQDVTDDHHIKAVFEVATSVSDEEAPSNVSVYPNPAREHVNVKASQVIHQIEVWDINGKRLLAKEVGNQTSQIDVTGLNDGFYIVRVVFDEYSKSLKLNIQR